MKNTKKNENVSVKQTTHNRGLSKNCEYDLHEFKQRLYYSALHYQSLYCVCTPIDDDISFCYKEFNLLLKDLVNNLNNIIDKHSVDLPF